MQIRYTVNTSMSGSRVTEVFNIPDDLGVTQGEWEALSSQERQLAINDDYQIWKDNIIDGGWEYVNQPAA